jgi:hypothetical protein
MGCIAASGNHTMGHVKHAPRCHTLTACVDVSARSACRPAALSVHTSQWNMCIDPADSCDAAMTTSHESAGSILFLILVVVTCDKGRRRVTLNATGMVAFYIQRILHRLVTSHSLHQRLLSSNGDEDEPVLCGCGCTSSTCNMSCNEHIASSTPTRNQVAALCTAAINKCHFMDAAQNRHAMAA